MSRYILFFLLLTTSLSALTLKDKLDQAQTGDYFITSLQKNFTAWLVRDKQKDHLLIEEITLPQAYAQKTVTSWKQWLEQGAPRHTGKVSYTLELPSGNITQYYSHILKTYCQIPSESNLFTTLLNLSFETVPDNQRRRIGGGRFGKYWQPRLTYEGEHKKEVTATPWKTQWPSDKSELAGKTVTIYLPDQADPFRTYFPYWVQVTTGTVKAHLRVVDSGQINPSY